MNYVKLIIVVAALVALGAFTLSITHKKYKWGYYATGLIFLCGILGSFLSFDRISSYYAPPLTVDEKKAVEESKFVKCTFMLRNTIDITIKAAKWNGCLSDLSKGLIAKGSKRQEDCRYISELYNTSLENRNKEYDDFQKEINNR